MFHNIIWGFILPWFMVSPLTLKQPKLFIVISPISALISIYINTVGYYFDYWHFKPIIKEYEALSAMPLDVGLYAILGTIFIYSIVKKPFGIHPIVIHLLYSVLTTLMEFATLKFDLVIYDNGWNIGWTFISYYVAYLLVFTAWRIVRNHIELLD
ncbi:hypothetical protein [Fontibacillus sp. BL9]|uniref:hypothetical protein n=1 Tax=Fontibacillus sp. BL9 TaxID=3389971 RepID=UPI003979317E